MSIYGCYTTIPSRENYTNALHSFFRQTQPIEQVILSLPLDTDYNSRHIKDKRIKVVRPAHDYGPGTKLLGCYNYVPEDSYIFIIDDDIEYLPDLLKTLYNYNRSVVSFDTCSAASLGGVCGFEGYLVKKNTLSNIKVFYNSLPKECIYVDDMWIGLYFAYMNVSVRYIKSIKHSFFTRIQSWKSTIFDSNSLSYKTLSHTLKNKECFDIFTNQHINLI